MVHGCLRQASGHMYLAAQVSRYTYKERHAMLELSFIFTSETWFRFSIPPMLNFRWKTGMRRSEPYYYIIIINIIEMHSQMKNCEQLFIKYLTKFVFNIWAMLVNDSNARVTLKAYTWVHFNQTVQRLNKSDFVIWWMGANQMDIFAAVFFFQHIMAQFISN